ncbi:MAG TPA: hypothetical protein VF544_20955 [Pyrinomonadaceae bacterium]|jgi:hypothetical protein
MSRISAETFEQICDGVWRDRAAVLCRCGTASGEDALMRAVYWRIRKVGGEPEQGFKDHTSLLDKLLEHYRGEAELTGRKAFE